METSKAVNLKTSFTAENPESAIQNSSKNSCSGFSYSITEIIKLHATNIIIIQF